MSVNLPVQSTGALPTVRRLVLYILLFTLVTLAAVGAAGLLGLLFTSGSGDDPGRTDNLARSLAFVIIAGPLALLLWRSLAKRLLDSFESAALAWGLYVAAMYSTSLVVASTGLFVLLGKLLSAHTQGWAQDLSTALIWAGVCWWHHHMWSDTRRSPRSLPNLPGILASWYAVTLVATATVSALVMVFSAAVDSIFHNFSAGFPWWRGALAQLPWIVGGFALWWWHWTRKHIGKVHGGFADVALVLLGVLAAGAAALGGTGYLLYALGRSAVHGTDAQSLSPVPLSLGAALVGALIFSLAWQELGSRSVETMSAGRLVSAGLGLASMASGFGVCINALLAALTPPLAGDRGTDLLLAGLIWLVLGSLVWVGAWRPHKPADPRGRRVYLVAVFGVSAVVALIALLFAGFRIFTFFLEPGTLASGLLDSVRAPIGLLTATLLVAIYHFAVWRSDRTLIEATAPASSGTIESIILVAGEESPEISRALGAMTGAKIQVLVRAGEGYQASADELTAALDAAETQSPRIMLLVEGAGSVRVIDLA
ncbi:DUF5671 domain-containing protein [Specibacter sp. NPDC078709]|uniref:DUF5671 domain-containing protein n=1 Tax=Specibacter sp. NPDC078709 TaxID=3154364 RepID=UPI00341D3F44